MISNSLPLLNYPFKKGHFYGFQELILNILITNSIFYNQLLPYLFIRINLAFFSTCNYFYNAVEKDLCLFCLFDSQEAYSPHLIHKLFVFWCTCTSKYKKLVYTCISFYDKGMHHFFNVIHQWVKEEKRKSNNHWRGWSIHKDLLIQSCNLCLFPCVLTAFQCLSWNHNGKQDAMTHSPISSPCDILSGLDMQTG